MSTTTITVTIEWTDAPEASAEDEIAETIRATIMEDWGAPEDEEEGREDGYDGPFATKTTTTVAEPAP